ncbi:MAG TPA: type II secretion system protein [Syntrophales bacterium]|nr:type II secretion system protein [Syntrophales bacterium]
MRPVLKDPRGFTLIEAISAIVIMTIVSALAGMGLIQIANGYAFAKKNAVIAQRAQIALTRLSKELSALQSVSASPTPTSTSLTYVRNGAAHAIAWTGVNQPLTLDGDILIDKVQNFSLTYYNKYNDSSPTTYSSATAIIQITLELLGGNDTTLVFTDRVAI